MKKIIISLFMGIILLAGCEDFLDTKDLVRKNSDNFPSSQADFESALTAAYSTLCNYDLSANEPLFYSLIISDECFGNGGAGDQNWQALNRLLRTPSGENAISSAWSVNYQGIFRCNSILNAFETHSDITFASQAVRDQLMGETYALRAYYYFNLALTFGPYVPIRLQPIDENLPAASVEELYSQIGDDLNKAISLLPNKSIQDLGVGNIGHFTRWATQALIARVWLFYTGYYSKPDLPTLSGSISKSQIITYLEDCIANSGHALLPDYRNNFVYGNNLTAPDYPYARDNNLSWAGDEGGNTESVFVIKNSIFNDNRWGLLFGIRSQPKANTFPFRDGWGATSVNPRFVEQWYKDEPDDIRIKASVIDTDDPGEGLEYQKFVDQGEETFMFVKKLMNVNAYDANRNIYNFSLLAYGGNDGQSHSAVDQIRIRFADVLLMHSELTETATGLNRIRQRVGLSEVSYSMEALQKERCHELAFEGYRYYDLLRWYGVDAGRILEENQNGIITYRSGIPETQQMYMTKRIGETGGFLQVPKSELDLSNGVLQQNPGWLGNDILFLP